MLDIMRVPGLQGHLSCLEVKFNFSNQFLILNSNLQSLSKAVQGVEDNPELRQVFLILLKVGNYLNQGTGKGNALSFNLELLSNLKNSKAVGASHSKSSMLDFLLESILRSKSPNIARFALKLEPCKEASKLELKILEEQLKNFKRQ